MTAPPLFCKCTTEKERSKVPFLLSFCKVGTRLVMLSPSLLLRFAQDKAQGKLREASRSPVSQTLRSG